MRFSSTEVDSDLELGVLGTCVGSTLESGADKKIFTVVDIGGCGPLDEVALDITDKLAVTDTSTLETRH